MRGIIGSGEKGRAWDEGCNEGGKGRGALSGEAGKPKTFAISSQTYVGKPQFCPLGSKKSGGAPLGRRAGGTTQIRAAGSCHSARLQCNQVNRSRRMGSGLMVGGKAE